MSGVELYKENGFEEVEQLPIFTYGHCIVSVNENHIFLAGGFREDGDT